MDANLPITDEYFPDANATQETIETSPVVVGDAKASPTHCALIDDNDIFVGMVEFPTPETVTERHLLQITECDLPAGQYKWHSGDQTFHSVKTRQAQIDNHVNAVMQHIKELQKHDVDVPLDVLIWLKQVSQ